MTASEFREDLFYRLNVIPLRLPPLRERIEDVEPIARVFLNRAGYRKAILAPASVQVLQSYTWPGNVRELCNVLERAAIMAGGETIWPEHVLLEEEPLGKFVSRQIAEHNFLPVIEKTQDDPAAILSYMRRASVQKMAKIFAQGIHARNGRASFRKLSVKCGIIAPSCKAVGH
jgi:DNA-binding NtrC family response regulator